MFQAQVQKKGAEKAAEVTPNLDNIAGYQAIKEKVKEVNIWLNQIKVNSVDKKGASASDRQFAEIAYNDARKGLYADAKSLLTLLNSSTHGDKEFGGAKSYILTVVNMLENGQKLTVQTITDKILPELRNLDTSLDVLIRKEQTAAREETARQQREAPRSRLSRITPRKTGIAPKKAAPKIKEPREDEIKAFAARIPGLINSLKDGHVKNSLNQRIETLAAYRYSKQLKEDKITMKGAMDKAYYAMAKASDIGLAPQMKTDEAMAAFLDLMVSNAYKYSSKKYFQ